jgi:hypothetical protein
MLRNDSSGIIDDRDAVARSRLVRLLGECVLLFRLRDRDLELDAKLSHSFAE